MFVSIIVLLLLPSSSLPTAVAIASLTFRMCWAVSKLPGFMMPGHMFTVGAAAVIAIMMDWNVEEESCSAMSIQGNLKSEN